LCIGLANSSQRLVNVWRVPLKSGGELSSLIRGKGRCPAPSGLKPTASKVHRLLRATAGHSFASSTSRRCNALKFSHETLARACISGSCPHLASGAEIPAETASIRGYGVDLRFNGQLSWPDEIVAQVKQVEHVVWLMRAGVERQREYVFNSRALSISFA